MDRADFNMLMLAGVLVLIMILQGIVGTLQEKRRNKKKEDSENE